MTEVKKECAACGSGLFTVDYHPAIPGRWWRKAVPAKLEVECSTCGYSEFCAPGTVKWLGVGK